MNTTEPKHPFGELLANWRTKNEKQYANYIEIFSITDEDKIESHPWYNKRVEQMPVFRYKLPGDVLESDYDWELLLKLLESTDICQVTVRFENIKLVCRNMSYPELIVKMYGINKIVFLMNSKELEGFFYDLIDENIKMILRTRDSQGETRDYEEITKFQRNYWMFVAEKINAKLKVSEIISGNEEIMKYVNGDGK